MDLKSNRIRFVSLIRPGYMIAATSVIALILIVSAVFELSESKKEIYKLMTEEAVSLVETVNMSSSNTVLSNEEIEDLIAQRLLSTARMTSYLDSLRTLTRQDLEMIARENEVFRVNIFNGNGEKVASSHIPDSTHLKKVPKHEPKDFFEPLLKGETDEIVIGLKEARFQEGKRFAVAVRRKSNRGGAVVVNVDASYLLEFRKKIGFGKMIQDIGDNSGIEYIMLQDEKGIITASRNITEMLSINDDPFLSAAYESDSAFTRTTDFNGKQVFEVVKTFYVDRERYGMFRLGISMDQVRALESQMFRRGIILSVVLFVIAAIAIGGILVSQNLRLTRKEYKRIQTYTGNILQNMADAVITTDSKGCITLFNKNAEALFGVTEQEALGNQFFGVLGKQFLFLTEALNERIKISDAEVSYGTKKGAVRILSASTTFTLDEKDAVDAFTIVLRDVTDMKNIEKQILQKEKMAAMGELASGVAHEIRNPLNAISMIAQRYETEFKPVENPGEYRQLTGVLLSETKRVNNIIQQFLRFARPPKLTLSNVSSSKLLEDLRGLIEVQCRSRGIDFTVTQLTSRELRLDVEQMKQALLNVLQNAVDATEKGGKISVLFDSAGNKARFEINDTGKGIPEEQKEKIFNLYFTTKADGTGMGLSIVQQIVSQHNGKINIESKTGKGTKFIVELPLS